jgi:hypothetical protein
VKHINITHTAPLVTARSLLDSISPPSAKAYRIRWAWKLGKRTLTAVTTWVFPGDAQAALRNFKQRRPEAVTAVVEEGGLL